MAFIVRFKIKKGGFDSHMHSTSLYHPSPSISKTIPTYPTPPPFFGGGGMSQEPDIYFIWSYQ